MKLKKINKLGSSRYYLSEDKKYFYKKSKKNIVDKEYNNLKKLQNVCISNLNFLKPIGIKNDILVTEYVEARSLVDLIRPQIYYDFGRILKKFHKLGYAHSHLQINDVLYKNKVFILTDLVNLNEKEFIYDLAIFKLSIQFFKLKKPWNWWRYSSCFKSFLKGYGLKENNILDNKFYEIITLRINKFIKRPTLKSLFVVLILKLIKKIN